jgi:hypothetical protein
MADHNPSHCANVDYRTTDVFFFIQFKSLTTGCADFTDAIGGWIHP